jgi:hypothetical protein
LEEVAESLVEHLAEVAEKPWLFELKRAAPSSVIKPRKDTVNMKKRS